MAVRKRAPRAKGGPAAAPAPRVVRIVSTEKWEELLDKAEAQDRLVVVQFYQAS